MVLQHIYIVRHAFRSQFILDPASGQYSSPIPCPTGIPTDPALTSYGEAQAEQLAQRLAGIEPAIDVLYSSPFYRCIQTLGPTAARLGQARGGGAPAVRIETGLGEFFSQAAFEHPAAAPLPLLGRHFAFLDHGYEAVLRPPRAGETVRGLHDRVARTLDAVIAALDAAPGRPATLLLCTHAGCMIAAGRVLTGHMPADVDDADFKCYTCSLSVFERRSASASAGAGAGAAAAPPVDWRNGKGVQGGWNCLLNGDCSHLSGGAERGWNFFDDDAIAPDSPLPESEDARHSVTKPRI